jgi:hypothetical protein
MEEFELFMKPNTHSSQEGYSIWPYPNHGFIRSEGVDYKILKDRLTGTTFYQGDCSWSQMIDILDNYYLAKARKKKLEAV